MTLGELLGFLIMNLLHDLCISIFLNWYLYCTHHVLTWDGVRSYPYTHINLLRWALQIRSIAKGLKHSVVLLLLIGDLINLSRLKSVY